MSVVIAWLLLHMSTRPAWSADGPGSVAPRAFDGIWEDEIKRSPEGGLSQDFAMWSITQLDIKYPTMVSTRFFYDSETAKNPFVTIQTVASIEVSKNQLNPKVLNLDFEGSKSIAYIRQASPLLKKPGLAKCAIVGTTIDLTKTSCDWIRRLEGKRYDIMMIVDGDMMLRGFVRPPAKTAALRNLSLSIIPFKKKK